MHCRFHIPRWLTMLLMLGAAAAGRAEVFVDQSHDARSMLGELRADVEDQQWQRAGYLVDQLLDKYAAAVVPIQPYRYVAVTDVLSDLAGRSARLLEMLRNRDASRAAAARDIAGDDTAQLERVSRRYRWTAAGQRAGLQAAGLLLERAQFEHAKRVLADLLQAPGLDDRVTPARVLAATAAIYTSDLATLREHVVALRDRGDAAELASLKHLARRVQTPAGSLRDTASDVRLGFDDYSQRPPRAGILHCKPASGGPAAWSLRPAQLREEWKNAAWAGRPILHGDRAYVPVRVNGPAKLVQVFIAAIGIEDGSLIWARRVYARTEPRGRSKHVGLCELDYGAGTLYASVDGRMLCRLSPHAGEVRWIALRAEPDDEPDEDAISPWTRQRIAALPAGVVMIQPGNNIVVYDPRDGQVRRRIAPGAWRNPLHLRGMGDGVMAFGDRVVRIDGRTLEPTWISERPFDPRSFNAASDRAVDTGPRRTRSLRHSVGGRIDSKPLNTRVPDGRVR